MYRELETGIGQLWHQFSPIFTTLPSIDKSSTHAMSAELIASVIAQGERLATHSWEYGAYAEALLEWYDPSSAVFGADPFPGGKIPVLQVDQTRSLAYAELHISTNSTTLIDGDGKLV